MVEEEVAKVDGKESGRSNEKGHPQPKQLVQQQCHQGASLDMKMKGESNVLFLGNGMVEETITHPPAPVSKDGRHEGDGCGSGGLGGQDGHVSHH